MVQLWPRNVPIPKHKLLSDEQQASDAVQEREHRRAVASISQITCMSHRFWMGVSLGRGRRGERAACRNSCELQDPHYCGAVGAQGREFYYPCFLLSHPLPNPSKSTGGGAVLQCSNSFRGSAAPSDWKCQRGEWYTSEHESRVQLPALQ